MEENILCISEDGEDGEDSEDGEDDEDSEDGEECNDLNASKKRKLTNFLASNSQKDRIQLHKMADMFSVHRISMKGTDLFCHACCHIVKPKKSILKNHCKSDKHQKGTE
jgi:hypothetical protein